MEKDLEQIFDSDLPEIEKLAHAYLSILRQHEAQSRRDIELCKVLQDDQGLLKEQIKMETLKYGGEIFSFCYFRSTGRKLSND